MLAEIVLRSLISMLLLCASVARTIFLGLFCFFQFRFISSVVRLWSLSLPVIFHCFSQISILQTSCRRIVPVPPVSSDFLWKTWHDNMVSAFLKDAGLCWRCFCGLSVFWCDLCVFWWYSTCKCMCTWNTQTPTHYLFCFISSNALLSSNSLRTQLFSICM